MANGGGIMLPAPTPSKQSATSIANQIVGQTLLEAALKAEAEPPMPPAGSVDGGLPPIFPPPPGMDDASTVVIDAGQASEGRRPEYDEYVEVRPTRPSRTSLALLLGGVAAASMVGLPLLTQELNARSVVGDRSTSSIQLFDAGGVINQSLYLNSGLGETDANRDRRIGEQNRTPAATAVNTQANMGRVVDPRVYTEYATLSSGPGAPRSATAPTTSLVDNNPGGNRIQVATSGVSGIDVPAPPKPSVTKPLKKRIAERVLFASRDKPYTPAPQKDIKVQMGGRRGGGIKVKLTPSEFTPMQTRSGAVVQVPASGSNRAGSSRLVVPSPASTQYSSNRPTPEKRAPESPF